jgi:hypothetical protein
MGRDGDIHAAISDTVRSISYPAFDGISCSGFPFVTARRLDVFGLARDYCEIVKSYRGTPGFLARER